MPNQPLMMWLHNLFSSEPDKTGGDLRKISPALPKGMANAVAKEQFESQLEDIISHHPTVTTGRVQVINLEKIRDQLGEKWDKRATIAHQIVCAAIDRRLAPDDIYSQYSDLDYVIVFANLDKKQAQLKSVLIAKEIAMKMLGNDDHTNFIEVNTLAAKANGQVSFEKLPSIADLAQDMESPQEPKYVVPDGAEDNLPLQNEDIQFIFRPIWFVKHHVVSTFLCIPVRDIGQGSYVSSYSVLHDSNDSSQIFELDILTAQAVNRELVRAHNEGNKALFAIPVHFETLANHNRRTTYFETCRTALKQADNEIIFEVVGLPDGVPDSRVVDILSPLKPLSRSVLARFSIEHRDFMGFHAAGVHGVGIDLFEYAEGEKKLLKDMEKFVAAANKSALKTYVHGVHSLSLNTAAVTSGFDYIDGYVLTSVSESTEGAYFLEIKDLYKS
jgi:hypothetical protein